MRFQVFLCSKNILDAFWLPKLALAFVYTQFGGKWNSAKFGRIGVF